MQRCIRTSHWRIIAISIEANMQKDKSEQDETHSSSDFFEYYFPCFVFIFVESFIPLIVLLVCLFCRDLIILENDIFF